jgi:ATP-dependent helicase HrpA
LRRQPSLPHGFLERNAATRARIEQVESRLRRRDLLASDEALVRFYLERVPPHIASTRVFERWWRGEEAQRPHWLDAPEEVFLAQPLPRMDPADFPSTFDVDGNVVQLRYHFDPTAPDDGVTLELPLPLLRTIDARRLEWLIPGWLREKVILLLRGLPKDVRREIVPIPDAADRFMASVERFGEGSLIERLAAFATQEAGAPVFPAQVAAVVLPPWLSFNVNVLDHAGHRLRASRDIAALRDEFRGHAGASAFADARPGWERSGVRAWDFGDLPSEIILHTSGLSVRAYPGLQDDGASIRLRVFTSAAAAARATRDGLVRLAAIALSQQHDMVRRHLAAERDFSLLVAATGFGKDLLLDVADRAVADVVLAPARRLPTTRAEFETLLEQGRSDVVDRGADIARSVRSVLAAAREVRSALGTLTTPAFAATRDAVSRQLQHLLSPGWVRTVPDGWWPQVPKYVRALSKRIERARGDVARDARLQALIEPYESVLQKLSAAADPERAAQERERLRWMIEEYRLSVFAQDLKTLLPISARRLDEQVVLAQREAGLTPVGLAMPAATSRGKHVSVRAGKA